MIRSNDNDAASSTSAAPGVTLTSLRQGDQGVLLSAGLRPADQDYLTALGFALRSPFRLCQAGDPWIVQVRGTRIGLSEQVAKNLRVTRSEA